MKFLLVAFLVAGCGGKKDEPPKSEPQGSTPATEPAKPTPAPKPQEPPPPPKDLGSCTFSIGGAATVEDTSRGGINAVSASYWTLDERARRMLFGDGKHGLIINCDGKLASVSFTAGDQDDKTIPYGPKKYEIKKLGKNVFSQLGRLKDASSASLMAGEGTLEITAFDAEHLAGEFDLTATYMTKDKTDKVTIKGKFDYKCPNKCK